MDNPSLAFPQAVPQYFVARKHKEWTGHAVPTQQLYQSLWGVAGHGETSLLDDRQRVLAEKLSAPTTGGPGRVAFWCAGGRARDMLTRLPEMKPHVRFIVDQDQARQGGTLEGIESVSPQRRRSDLATLDAVLIATPAGMPVYNELAREGGFRGKLLL